jgi:hypothetical protein
LKTFYLCKVSFMNSLNKYFQFEFYMYIVLISLYNH